MDNPNRPLSVNEDEMITSELLVLVACLRTPPPSSQFDPPTLFVSSTNLLVPPRDGSCIERQIFEEVCSILRVDGEKEF